MGVILAWENLEENQLQLFPQGSPAMEYCLESGFRESTVWEFPGSPVVRTPVLSLPRARVRSLVRKLRSGKRPENKQTKSMAYSVVLS